MAVPDNTKLYCAVAVALVLIAVGLAITALAMNRPNNGTGTKRGLRGDPGKDGVDGKDGLITELKDNICTFNTAIGGGKINVSNSADYLSIDGNFTLAGSLTTGASVIIGTIARTIDGGIFCFSTSTKDDGTESKACLIAISQDQNVSVINMSQVTIDSTDNIFGGGIFKIFKKTLSTQRR
jgi:hypothetical protein